MDSRVNVSRPSGASRYRAPEMRMGRSQFDLTHSHKTTFEVGQLIPYLVMEVVPGDTMTCRMEAFCRIFSPLDAPLMDDIMLDIDFFYVPTRLVWSHFDDHLGYNESAGAQTVSFITPKIADGWTCAFTELYAYMGVPIGLQSTQVAVSALPGRAYRKIYNDWYRDQNLIADVSIPVDSDGPDAASIAQTIYKTAKKHDYFTSALPYLQKGNAPGVLMTAVDTAIGPTFKQVGGGDAAGGELFPTASADAPTVSITSPTGTWNAALKIGWDNPNLQFSVSALREAEAIQRLLERDARGGTRLPELIKSHFGVDVPDFRLQRSEYLGGGKGFINVSPIANTSDTASKDQGELTGVGAGTVRASWAKSFVEFGFVIGLLRARGQLSYQQGLERMWTRGRGGKYDYLWPEFVNLGEQAIYKKELFVSNSAATDDAVFGYQERYADYRWKKSLVTGKLQSDVAGSLDFWHLAEDFSAAPTLGATFIEDATPMSRVTTVDSEPDFVIDGRFDVRVARVLPVRPVPSLAPMRF